jgi:hypothetical protein
VPLAAPPAASAPAPQPKPKKSKKPDNQASLF